MLRIKKNTYNNKRWPRTSVFREIKTQHDRKFIAHQAKDDKKRTKYDTYTEITKKKK